MDMTLSRKQIAQALDTTPLESILGKGARELTHKQKTFAKTIAKGGVTKADAYRIAYDAKGNPKSVGSNASRLAADERIKAEIAAYQRAIEAAEHRTPTALRDLVIHSLVQTLIDPETGAAQRIQAAKVLGTVTEVAAFTDRKEVMTITSSADAREKVMHELRLMMNQDAEDATVLDADSLMAELHPPVGATSVEAEPRSELHTTPLEQIPSLDDPTPSIEGDPLHI
jgi:hypothetical protein